MDDNELGMILLWVLLPPFALGVAALALMPLRQRLRGWRLAKSALVLLLVATAFVVALMGLGPEWLARYIGIRDISIFGTYTLWAPVAFLSVALGLPATVWWATRGGR